jgi:MSHA biogenesis protein MshJ
MKAQLEQLLARIDAFALRERILLFLTLVFVLFVIWNGLLLGPVNAEKKRIATELAGLQQQTASAQQQIQSISAGVAVDPNKENRERAAALKQELAMLDENIGRLAIGAAELTKVLSEVLTREPELKLVRIRNLVSAPLEVAVTAPSGAGAIYQHGLVIELEGGYFSTLRYLKALESLPWQLSWSSLDYKVKDYPLAHITLIIHTLGLTEGALGV